MKKQVNWLLVGVLLASFLAGCAAPTPQVIEKEVVVEKPVVQTVVVEKQVVVEKEVAVEVTRVVEKEVEVPAAAAPVTLKLYNPTGAFEVTQTFAPRLDTLADKTICMVTNGSWQASRTDALILELLQKQYPTAKFVSTDNFPRLSTTMDVAGLEDAVKAAGCQAAIVSNAG